MSEPRPSSLPDPVEPIRQERVPPSHPTVVHPVQSADEQSILKRALAGDRSALEGMIRSFIPDDERLVSAAFLGSFGLIFRQRAFFAVTDRRAVSIIIGPFRHLSYQDGLLEYINSSGIRQPSRGPLYFKLTLLFVFTLGIGLLFVPAVSRSWFRKNKAGLFLNVREGLSIVTFADAASMPVAMSMYREFTLARDDRLGHLALSAV